jgi:hypothetical protein
MFAATLVVALVVAVSPAGVESVESSATPDPASCTATDGAFAWGFKESFRAYISGSIANGEWSTEGGIGYATPDFSSDALSGEVSLDTMTGELSVDGAMRFVGHDGILDTTIADPQLRFEGFDRLTMVVDVTGTTQDFVEVSALDVPFVTADLATADWRIMGEQLVIAQIPLALTVEGAEAFGTYPEGEPFDALTLELDTGADCATAALEARAAAGVPVGLIAMSLLALVVVSVAGYVGVRARRRLLR